MRLTIDRGIVAAFSAAALFGRMIRPRSHTRTFMYTSRSSTPIGIIPEMHHRHDHSSLVKLDPFREVALVQGPDDLRAGATARRGCEREFSAGHVGPFP